MTLSDLSISRPVLATVLSLLIVLAGLAAFQRLPVREYPDVDRPTVSITTVYLGASAQTVESSITEPIEQALNGVDGIRSIVSESRFGGATVTIEFDVGRDLDLAATDVSNAVQRAMDRLPDEARRPVVRKSSADARPIIWLQVRSDEISPLDLTDIADRYVKTPLQILPGVAGILVGGQRTYAMRVWLDPERMAARGVDPNAVRRAIRDNNLQLPAGHIEADTRRFTVLANAQLVDEEDFENIVVRWEGGAPVRLRDVGQVELGSANYDTITRFDSRPIIAIGIIRQSDANELALTKRLRTAIPRIQKTLPPGVTLETALDNTVFVEASLKEVMRTLGIALVLVILVNLFFLRSPVATMIPSIAIPVSLIGTLAVMNMLGFSINVLTLLAFVLAIGLLVDDAIVVLENAYRRQELGEDRVTAAKLGTQEVFFAVIATTVALVAVLVPLSMMTGGTGRLFREFAITMAAAVTLSTFVALSLVPVLCARYLNVTAQHGRVWRWIETVLDALNRVYERGLAFSVRHPVPIVLFLVANALASVALFAGLPDSLAPTEDRGKVLTILRAPQGATLAYTRESLLGIERTLQGLPGVDHTFSAVGLSSGGSRSTSRGFVYGRLLPWGERKVTQQGVVRTLYGKLREFPGVLAFPVSLPSLGQSSIYDIEVVLKSSAASLREFDRVSHAIVERVSGVDGVVNVDRDLRMESPQIEIHYDRDRAAELGVPVAAIADAMQVAFAEAGVSEFVLRNRQYDVIPSLAPKFRMVPEQIGDLHVRSRMGAMVPLSSLVRISTSAAPESLNHFDLERSVKISGSIAPGFSLGPILRQIEEIARQEMPAGYTLALTGNSREFYESSAELYATFAVSLLFIYLVLAAQFESFVDPITILLSVPLALLGALGALYASGYSINIFTQVGMILLVGLVAKNSILLVDYANRAHSKGADLLEAALGAGRTRFRPILMTSITSILGALPLMLASGAGAETRQPIGAAVVGGLVFSTVFTLLIIPVVHVLVVRSAERISGRSH